MLEENAEHRPEAQEGRQVDVEADLRLVGSGEVALPEKEVRGLRVVLQDTIVQEVQPVFVRPGHQVVFGGHLQNSPHLLRVLRLLNGLLEAFGNRRGHLGVSRSSHLRV